MTPLDVLDRMERILAGGQRWWQGDAINDEGTRVCLLRAGGDAVNLDQVWYQEYRDRSRALRHVSKIMESVIREQFHDRSRSGSISIFNDHSDTTWPDVALVLGKTRVLLEEEVA